MRFSDRQEGETIFIFGNCFPFCNTFMPVFNDKSERIVLEGDGEVDISTLRQDPVVRKPEELACKE